MVSGDLGVCRLESTHLTDDQDCIGLVLLQWQRRCAESEGENNKNVLGKHDGGWCGILMKVDRLRDESD